MLGGRDNAMMNVSMNEALKGITDSPELERAIEIGKLTGLKFEEGRLRGSNFERGLLLRKIIRERRPVRVLELGTGRGFGSLCMADCAVKDFPECRIETVDRIPGNLPQGWPHEKNGQQITGNRALDEFWKSEFPELEKVIVRHVGHTSQVLRRLLETGKSYDFIFIDAGHDVRSVFLDLAASIALLSPGGCILMDDFAPLESFGLATCIAVHHARPYFDSFEIVPTEGLVYPSDLPQPDRRSMALLSGRNSRKSRYRPSLVLDFSLRIAGRLLDWLYSPRAFPF
jgi:predicted O-methyltransferase YrrM